MKFNFTPIVKREYPDRTRNGYDGLNIGKNRISLSTKFTRRLMSRNCNRLTFAVDKENNAILVKPSTENDEMSYKVTFHHNKSGSLAGNVLSRHAKGGRYVINDVTPEGWILTKS
jgi:hypothetical protein